MGKVRLIYLPSGKGGVKIGLDDYLTSGHHQDDLLCLATSELRPLPRGDDAAPELPYRDTAGGLCWDRPTAGGSVPVQLTNFSARITAQVVEDDGAETRRLFDVETQHRGISRPLSVAAATFDNLAWVSEHLGSNAVVYPGQMIRGHTSTAIRLLSGEVPEQRIYTHTGWRELDSGTWVFLHGGGAIGQVPPGGIGVRLLPQLSGFQLPDPPDGACRVEAIRASLRLLDLADDLLSLILLAGLWRAVLGAADFAVHLVGPTGTFKSELAALIQQHFGRELDARSLPGAWSWTENALEMLAFGAKDVVCTIDDFAPTGTGIDVQRLHAKADRVVRAQGNRSGRGRLRPDGTLRPTRSPRGLILSTGEDIPQGQSLRSRMLILEVSPGDVDVSVLTECQQYAASGALAESLAAFVAWLAPQYPLIVAGFQREVTHYREQAAASRQHRRTPVIVAHLAVGLGYFLKFAQAAGALTAQDAKHLWERGWKAFGAVAVRQGNYQAAGEPARRFVELVGAAIASGKAHVADLNGQPPDNAGAWGWRQGNASTFGEKEWRAQGERIGWIEGDHAYLIPDIAYSLARRIGNDTGDGLAVSSKTLHKRLREQGFLASCDIKRETLLARKTAEGKRREVLHLKSSHLMSEEPDQPDQPGDGTAPVDNEETPPGLGV